MRFGSPKELKRFLEEVLKEPRWEILRYLALRSEASTDEILAYLSKAYRRISRNALYYHLNILKQYGLVEDDEGKPKRRRLKEKLICLVISEDRLNASRFSTSVKALGLIFLLVLLFPSAHVYAEPQKQVLILISEPLNDLYDKGFHDFIYRLNETLYEYNYTTNFRLASAVQLTPDIAANYSAVIVLFPKISSRYENETTLNALLTFLELSDRGFLLIGSGEDVNHLLYRFGRQIGEKQENVSITASFTEPVLKSNYTFELNETTTMKYEPSNYTTTPPYLYPKDYDTFELMRTNASGSVAVAAETVDNTRFVAFTAVEALKDNSGVSRGAMMRDMIEWMLGFSYGKLTASSRSIEVPQELKEGYEIRARVNVNTSIENYTVYLEVYRGTLLADKIEMRQLNATFYEAKRIVPEAGQADLVIVVHARGYGYRTSDKVHIIAYPNRQPVPLDPILATIFLISFIATLIGLIMVRREMEHE